MGARRLDVTRAIARAELDGWAATGLRVAAYRRRGSGARPGTDLPDMLDPGDNMIVAGPEEVVRRLNT